MSAAANSTTAGLQQECAAVMTPTCNMACVRFHQRTKNAANTVRLHALNDSLHSIDSQADPTKCLHLRHPPKPPAQTNLSELAQAC